MGEGQENQPWTPGPAETFGAEFHNQMAVIASRQMSEAGFAFQSSGDEGDKVVFIGVRKNGDGTKMTITFEKGSSYKTPAELAPKEEGK